MAASPVGEPEGELMITLNVRRRATAGFLIAAVATFGLAAGHGSSAPLAARGIRGPVHPILNVPHLHLPKNVDSAAIRHHPMTNRKV
jgi:hypothetical protein